MRMAKVYEKLYTKKETEKLMEDAKRFADYGALKFRQGEQLGRKLEIDLLLSKIGTERSSGMLCQLIKGYLKTRLKQLEEKKEK